jgi:hypothetical protein
MSCTVKEVSNRMKKSLLFWRVYTGLIILCCVSLVFIFGVFYSYTSYKSHIIQQAKKGIQAESDRMVGEIEGKLASFKAAFNPILKNFSDNKLSEADLLKALAEVTSTDSSVMRFGVVSNVSDGVSPKNICFKKDHDKIYLEEANASNDATKEIWYEHARNNGAGWSEPSFDENINSYVSVYSEPIYQKNSVSLQKEFKGVFYLTVSLAWLRDEMNSLNPEKKEFGTVLSKKGAILYHPIGDLVLSRSNIFDVMKANKASNQNYKKMVIILQKAVSGASGEGVNVGRTGEAFWYFYRPIPNTDWSLVVNFIKDAVPFDGKVLRRQKIQMALGLAAFLLSLLTFILCFYHAERFKPKKLWWISILFSFACIFVACFSWYLALSVPLNEYQQGRVIIDDQVSLNKFIVARSKLSKDLYNKEPIFIPTGIFIQTLEFVSSNNISVSGYVWQKYKKGQMNALASGFVMPEAKSLAITEAYRSDTDREQIIGWYFEAIVRQSFDYSKYPFDRPNISLWFKHKDFLKNVILVPDLSGYTFTSASVLPGLQRRMALPGYSFFGTFF